MDFNPSIPGCADISSFWRCWLVYQWFPEIWLKKYLMKPSSHFEDPNPGDSLYNHRIHSRYYSPYSFYKFKSELSSRVSDSSFSLLHNNIRSLKRNLENFQVHLLDELNFEFSIIGVSESKIISGKEMDFNPSIPGCADISSFWRCWLVYQWFPEIWLKKYLMKPSSHFEDPNPGDSLYNHRIHSRYYSPYSFYKFKSELSSRVSDSSFSLFT